MIKFRGRSSFVEEASIRSSVSAGSALSLGSSCLITKGPTENADGPWYSPQLLTGDVFIGRGNETGHQPDRAVKQGDDKERDEEFS
jgi:hypothetical protein